MGKILIIGAIVLVVWAGMEIQTYGVEGAFNGFFAPAWKRPKPSRARPNELATASGKPSKRAKNATTDCSNSTPSSPNRASPRRA